MFNINIICYKLLLLLILLLEVPLQKNCVSKFKILCILSTSMPPTSNQIASGKSPIEKGQSSFHSVCLILRVHYWVIVSSQ